MLTKQQTYDLLTQKGIAFESFEHAPVYTIEEMVAVGMPHTESIVKNLFLRDDKGKNYYIVTLAGDKKVDLKTLATLIPSRKLSFANEQRLQEFLGLQAGSVTPLGLLNNAPIHVTMVFDAALKGKLVGIHPMENTATVFLKFEDLHNLLKKLPNDIILCKI